MRLLGSPRKEQQSGSKPKQHGNVVHLRATKPERKASRKSNSRQRGVDSTPEVMNVSGLANLMPERNDSGTDRQSTSQQAQHDNPCRQVERPALHVNHSGHVEEDRDDFERNVSSSPVPSNYSLGANSLLASRTRSIEPSLGLHTSVKKQQALALPEQSPYAALSSLSSCLRANQMLSYVNDDEVVETPQDPHQGQIFFSKSHTAERQSQASQLSRNFSISKEQSLKEYQPRTGNSYKGFLGPSTLQFRNQTLESLRHQDNATADAGSYQPFDIQNSLERQLAELPRDQTCQKDDRVNPIDTNTFSTKSQVSPALHPVRPNDTLSVLPSYSVSHTNSKVEVQTPRRRKYNKSSQQCDTVRIDKGLLCVDPNNLEQQMRKQMRKKERAEPVQTGNIICAADLMKMEKEKTRNGGIKSKLKGFFKDSSSRKDIRLVSHEASRSQANNSSSQKSKQSEKSKASSKDSGKASSQHSCKENASYVDQEGYKVQRILPPGHSTDHGPVHPGSSVGLKQASRNMEYIMAAEGNSPIYKVSRDEREPQESERATGPQARMGAMARHWKHMDKLTSLAKSHMTSSAKSKNASSEIVQELGIDGPVSPPHGGGHGSFCLSNPSLDTIKVGSLNKSLNDILAMFAKEREEAKQLENSASSAHQDANALSAGSNTRVAVSEQETPRSRDQAMRDSKLLVLHSLKIKIIEELKKKKVREMQARALMKEGSVQSLQEREYTDAEIMELFNQHLLAAKAKVNGGTTAEEDDQAPDTTRRKVTFAAGSNLQGSYADEEGSHHDDGSDLADEVHNDRNISPWATCAANTYQKGSDNSKEQRSSERESAVANKDLGSSALRTLDHIARNSFATAQDRVKQIQSSLTTPATTCTGPETSFDYDDDSYGSDILSGSSCATSPRRAQNSPRRARKTTKSKEPTKEKLALVMSNSGSLFSGNSYYTEDSYDTKDSAYDPYEDDRRKGRRSRDHRQSSRKHHRRGDRRKSRRDPPSVFSDYTEYSSDGGCHVWD